MGRVTVTLTDEQLRLVNRAIEEYFRLRLNQWWDFADDVCLQGVDLSNENPNRGKVFDEYIIRRDALKASFEALFHQFTITTSQKSQDCMDLIDIWDAIRHWIWEQKPPEDRITWTVDAAKPLNEGQYPLPTIKREG